MNGRMSKMLRKEAELRAYEHYCSLISEEDAAELTIEKVLEYTPDVTYVSVETRASTQESPKRVRVVSQYTNRWFILQEKKDVRKNYH